MPLEAAVGWAGFPKVSGTAHLPTTLHDEGEHSTSLVVLVDVH